LNKPRNFDITSQAYLSAALSHHPTQNWVTGQRIAKVMLSLPVMVWLLWLILVFCAKK